MTSVKPVIGSEAEEEYRQHHGKLRRNIENGGRAVSASISKRRRGAHIGAKQRGHAPAGRCSPRRVCAAPLPHNI